MSGHSDRREQECRNSRKRGYLLFGKQGYSAGKSTSSKVELVSCNCGMDGMSREEVWAGKEVESAE